MSLLLHSALERVYPIVTLYRSRPPASEPPPHSFIVVQLNCSCLCTLPASHHPPPTLSSPPPPGRYEYTARRVDTPGGAVTWAGNFGSNAAVVVNDPTAIAEKPSPGPDYSLSGAPGQPGAGLLLPPYGSASGTDRSSGSNASGGSGGGGSGAIGSGSLSGGSLVGRAELALHFPRMFRLALRRLLVIRPHAAAATSPVEGEFAAVYCLALLGSELRARGETTPVLSALFDSCLRLGVPPSALGGGFPSAMTGGSSGGGGAASVGGFGLLGGSGPGGGGSGGGWFTTRSSVAKLLRRWLGEAGEWWGVECKMSGVGAW